MLKFVKGSIFDSKCDLLIIPCNDNGGVTRSIQKELMVNNLPYFHRSLHPGDIVFIENRSDFSNASMIGYAATVETQKIASTESNLRSIVRIIRDICHEQSMSKVNIPLLGTGSGGLPAKTSYNILKKEFEHEDNILVCVYTFFEDVYRELADEMPESTDQKLKNPRVFISYTGVDIVNRNWVKSFACRLRENGVDARLDMFHLKPGQDLPQWMTNELIMADKVLLICDKYYAEKADNRKGGVGWETMIIQGDMLSKQEQSKYIAILREKDIDQSLPIYVKSRYALNWIDESQIDREFEELLLYLFDCDIEPPIGEIPKYVRDKLAR
jgi:hypothetical protein